MHKISDAIDAKRILREIRILKHLSDHENILEIYDAFIIRNENTVDVSNPEKEEIKM